MTTRIDAKRISADVSYWPTGAGRVLIERRDNGRVVFTAGTADAFEFDRDTWLAVVAFVAEWRTT